jgi:hypothetical protein
MNAPSPDVETVAALADRWDDVLSECKAADPRWILDRSVTTLDTCLNELRPALRGAGLPEPSGEVGEEREDYEWMVRSLLGLLDSTTGDTVRKAQVRGIIETTTPLAARSGEHDEDGACCLGSWPGSTEWEETP